MGLGTKDLKSVLAFVGDAHDVDAPEPLTTELLDRLTELFGCEYATYIAFDWRQKVVTAHVPCSNELALGLDLDLDVWPEGFWTWESTDPRFTPHKSWFDKRSDRLSARERLRLRDEDEWQPEFGILDAIGFPVGDVETRSAWVSVDSAGRDFEERDRDLALALWPHIEAVWRRSVSRRQSHELLTALEADRGAIVLFEPGGRIEHATAEARRLLSLWFGTTNGRLPRELDGSIVRPGDRYTTRRNGSVLSVEAAGDFTLTLHERPAEPILTPREREVLGLVARGLTNQQIARQLWVAPSTVAKHLEQAYQKLGVHSRTAAIARLAEVADSPPHARTS